MKLQKAILAFSLLFLLSGCASFIRPDTTYLTSKDKTWIIPKSTSFQALGDEGVLKKYKIDVDLLVIYKGKYLELEKAADLRVLKAEKKGNSRAVLFSGIGTLLGAGIAAYFVIKKKKKKK